MKTSIAIRPVSTEDFDGIYPLLQQLWPDKVIDQIQMNIVL